MVKHTKTIRRQQPTNCLSMFDYFVKLVLKGLKLEQKKGKKSVETARLTLIREKYLFHQSVSFFLEDFTELL